MPDQGSDESVYSMRMSTEVIVKDLLAAARYAMKTSTKGILHLFSSRSAGTITVTCDGEDVRIQQTIPATVETSLHIDVVGKQLVAALKGFTARATVALSAVEDGLYVDGDGRTSLVSTGTPVTNHGPWRNFQPRPGIDMSETVDADEFRAMLTKAGATVGHDAKLPVFTCVRIVPTNDLLTVETTNRYAATRIRMAWDGAWADGPLIPNAEVSIPFKRLATVVATMRGRIMIQVKSGPDVFLDQVLAVEDADGRSAMIHLLGEHHPSLDRMLKPRSCDQIAVLDVASLAGAISQVGARLAKDTPLVFAFSPVGLVVRGLVGPAKTGGEQEWRAESVPCDYDGDPATIGFSPDYLPPMLDTLVGPTVTLRWTQPEIHDEYNTRYAPGVPVNVDDDGDDTTTRLVMSWGLHEDQWSAPDAVRQGAES